MKKYRSKFSFIRKLPVALLLLALVGSVLISPVARALTSQQIQDQINALRQSNAQTQGTVNSLQVQAGSYQDAINKLQSQINDIQNSINANLAQQEDLQRKIVAAEAELAKQKLILGENIKSMYLEGQISTLEMLASSKDLSEFVDKQQYRNSVKDKITATLAQITELKHQMQAQKEQVELLLKTEQEQQAKVDADRAEQSRLLSLNQAEQDQYNQQIKANKVQISSLQSQQAALNAAAGSRVYVSGAERGGACDNGSGNGGYSQASGSQGDVCDSAKDSIRDWYGIENRECTSYAYWYYTRVEGRPLRVSGDAKYWAYTSSVPVSSNPEVGAIGVSSVGFYGHVMIVQAIGPASYGGVNVPAGKVLVSSMNRDGIGHFGYDLYGVSSLVYINP